MSNLRKLMPQVSPTVQAIMDRHKILGDTEPHRGYLGASIIGHHCDRYLWYLFHDCLKPDFDGRLYRLFETGDLAEGRFTKELRAIGVTVHEVAENGLQFEVTALGGHFKGHMDGCGLGVLEAPKTWHVLEYKTHNKKSFSDLRSNGVKRSKPTHYAQMMVYMGLTKMRRALYLAVNKDTDELHSERIRFDKKEFELYMARAELIIRSALPLERCSGAKPEAFKCRYCDAKEMCFAVSGKNSPTLPVAQLSCKQCVHGVPQFDSDHGQWKCALKNTVVDETKPCADLLCLPGFFKEFAKTESVLPDSITYKNNDGAIWTQGNDAKAGHYNAKILMQLPAYLLVDKDVAMVKEEFNASVEGFVVCIPKTLLDAFAWEDSRLMWKGTPAELPAKCMELLKIDIAAAVPAQTSQDETHSAARFGDDICVVYYSNGTTAIWQGVS